jgi:nitroreductase
MINSTEIIKAYKFRHACKIFNDRKKISTEDFECILESARLSPSSFGFEPWKFLVIQNTQVREKLKSCTWGGQGQLSTASHFCVILARKDIKYDSEYINNFIHNVQSFTDEVIEKRLAIYKKFQEEDFRLTESERKMFDWASKQTYITLGNMMTTAAMLGIDSCPIEGFEPEKVEKILSDNCNVDLNKFGVSCMVAFGYRINPPQEKSRQKMDEIVSWF